ncbi:MAG: hypothetical protein CVU77_00545 [Elusimicrobia bacterium HGW-Elusimicrobia-1]|jgi:hypothetical protein|nr:MAG: hypothetical protein CVU77_00545 [Elusimicrobia bacterium HGW-Elusimicrobia-1]
MNLSKTHVNIVILEILLLVAGVTAILLKEVTARINVNILPEIKADAPEISVKDIMLPSHQSVGRVSAEQKKKTVDAKEVTIDLGDTQSASPSAPPPVKAPAKPKREDRPQSQEFTFELE